jgi:hypothetical protein
LGAAHRRREANGGADDLSELVFIWKDRTQGRIIRAKALAEIVFVGRFERKVAEVAEPASDPLRKTAPNCPFRCRFG